MKLKEGDLLQYSRLFTREDILAFAGLSHDTGRHHTAAEKLMAHGLMVASLPTKLGGDISFIARDMEFHFLKPVYEHDEITCVGKLEKMTPQSKRTKLFFTFECRNQNGILVMHGSSNGHIWNEI